MTSLTISPTNSLTEVLSRKLGVAAEDVAFSYHAKSCGLRLTHLEFDDDLLLFCRADVGSVGVLYSCLSEFFEMSGLRANMDKSLVFVDGVSAQVRGQICGLLGFGEGSFPTTYLGYPLHPKRLSRLGCAGLIVKVKSLVDIWATRRLSYAGRLKLLRSVVGGVLSFWFSASILPGCVVNQIKGGCWRFLWGGGNRASRCPVAWDVVTLARSEGGLGIKEALAWNKALFFKLVGDIGLSRLYIWTRWVATCYGRRGSFWDIQALDDDSSV